MKNNSNNFDINSASDKEIQEYLESWRGDEIVDYQKANPENW